jgi:hypothetical protein
MNIKSAVDTVKQHPILASAVIGSSTLVAGATGAAIAISHKKKSKKSRTVRHKTSNKRRSKSSKGVRHRKLKFGSKAFREKYLKHSKRHRSSKSNKRSHSTKRIFHTKTGQPYIKNSKGQARFISKKSARSSRKRKGGRY